MFTIRVYDSKNDRPAVGNKVQVFFDGLLRGNTKTERTNYRGEVDFEYDSGRGSVHVDGRNVYEGEISGRLTVYI